MTRTLYDASSPPPDPHLDVCGFYIGGDTPHVWTNAEITGQSARWRLPIYVCDNPAQRSPTVDAGEAVAWMRSHAVPAGSALALDYEMAVDGAYVTAFDKVVRSAGWTLLLYGSLSTVTQNPRPSAGYWTASWTKVPHLDPGAAATQYISDTQLGKGYDLSEVADTLILWDTKGAPEMEQTDAVVGSMSRGNKVGDVLADATNFRDQWYLAPGVDSKNPPPAGSRFNLLFGQLADIQAKVTAIAGGLDPKTLAATLAAALQPAITQAIQAGIAPEADQLAVVIEQHLAAALAAAK